MGRRLVIQSGCLVPKWGTGQLAKSIRYVGPISLRSNQRPNNKDSFVLTGRDHDRGFIRQVWALSQQALLAARCQNDVQTCARDLVGETELAAAISVYVIEAPETAGNCALEQNRSVRNVGPTKAIGRSRI